MTKLMTFFVKLGWCKPDTVHYIGGTDVLPPPLKGEEEQNALHDKISCCANEFVRYIHEHRPDVVHASLTDAMECLQIAWDGIPHSSIADTIACKKVWERLFPNYYED